MHIVFDYGFNIKKQRLKHLPIMLIFIVIVIPLWILVLDSIVEVLLTVGTCNFKVSMRMLGKQSIGG